MTLHEPWWPLHWWPDNSVAATSKQAQFAYIRDHPFVIYVHRDPSRGVRFMRNYNIQITPVFAAPFDTDELTVRSILLELAYGKP